MRKYLKKTEGFTLVELIVVIAILGILAGVGTVGYSGYIKKANLAVDEQMISDVKYAGQLGAITNPAVHGSVTISHKSDNNDAVINANTADEQTTINNWLESAFGTGWEASLRCISSTYESGVTIYFHSMTALNGLSNFMNSNFAGNEIVLTGSVNSLSDGMATWLSGNGGLSGLQGYFTEGAFDAFKTAYSLDSNSSETEIANATVLYVASQAANINPDEVFGMVSSGKTDQIAGQYGMIPTAAMIYGVMSGYANSEYASPEFKESFKTTPEGIGEVFELYSQMALEGNRDAYLNAAEGGAKNDLAGYLGALSVLNENSGKFEDDLNNEDLFSNEDTLKMLQEILQQAK